MGDDLAVRERRVTAAEMFQGHYDAPFLAAYDAIEGRSAVYQAVLDAFAQDVSDRAARFGFDSYWSIVGTINAGGYDAAELVADFQRFVSHRRRIAGSGLFTSVDLWRQFGIDFNAYHETLNQLDGVAARVVAKGGLTNPGDVTEWGMARRQGRELFASFAVYQSAQEPAVAELPEVIIAGAVMARLSAFHVASVEALNPAASPVDEVFVHFQRELAAYRDPLRAVDVLFGGKSSPLPHTTIDLSVEVEDLIADLERPDFEVPSIDTQNPAALQQLLLELMRVAARASSEGDKSVVGFEWSDRTRRFMACHLSGAFEKAWGNGAVRARLEQHAFKLGTGVSMGLSSGVGGIPVLAIQIPPLVATVMP